MGKYLGETTRCDLDIRACRMKCLQVSMILLLWILDKVENRLAFNILGIKIGAHEEHMDEEQIDAART